MQPAFAASVMLGVVLASSGCLAKLVVPTCDEAEALPTVADEYANVEYGRESSFRPGIAGGTCFIIANARDHEQYLSILRREHPTAPDVPTVYNSGMRVVIVESEPIAGCAVFSLQRVLEGKSEFIVEARQHFQVPDGSDPDVRFGCGSGGIYTETLTLPASPERIVYVLHVEPGAAH